MQKSQQELKKQDERIITRHFLRYYNKVKNLKLNIVSEGESPDIICKDSDLKHIGIELCEWLIETEVGRRKKERRKNSDDVGGGNFNPKEHTRALINKCIRGKLTKTNYQSSRIEKGLKQLILVIYLAKNALLYNPPGWLMNFDGHLKVAKNEITKITQNPFNEIWVFKAFKPDGGIYQIYPEK